MKKAGLAHILFTPQEENLTMRTEPVELLKRADTSKRITIYPHPLNKVRKTEKLYIEEQLNYDIIILLETMISEVTFNRYIKNDENLNTAELSIGTTNILKILNRLIRQKITFSGKGKLTFIKNWLHATNKRTKFIILHIPVLANKQENKYMIHYRENTGTDVHISLPSLLSSMIEAKKQKTKNNT
ncbi:hypothetical protein CB018_08975 [Salmonella enterica]|nr:hypothetical protein [Salmonella enterica]